MLAAAEAEQFEAAARLRDQLSTVHQLQEKQRIATAEQDDDADVFGYHFENGALAVNLFHMRNGKIVDRREFFWEDLPDLMDALAADFTTEEGAPSYPAVLSPDRVGNNEPQCAPFLKGHDFSRADDRQIESRALAPEGSPHSTMNPCAPSIPAALPPEWVGNHESQFNPGAVFSALLKQLYIDQHYVPRTILVPADFPDRETLASTLDRAHRPPHRNRRPPARRKTLPRRPRRPERQASPTPSASASSSPRARPFRKPSPTPSCSPSCPAASSASTSPTSRARKPSPPWWSGKTAR